MTDNNGAGGQPRNRSGSDTNINIDHHLNNGGIKRSSSSLTPPIAHRQFTRNIDDDMTRDNTVDVSYITIDGYGKSITCFCSTDELCQC
jgi:hypothetical protein